MNVDRRRSFHIQSSFGPPGKLRDQVFDGCGDRRFFTLDDIIELLVERLGCAKPVVGIQLGQGMRLSAE